MRKRFRDGWRSSSVAGLGASLGASLSIGLSATNITLVRSSGWLRRHSVVLAERVLSEEDVAAPERLAAQLRSMLTENKCQRLPVTIILSDTLVRLWSVTPPHNTVRLSDCLAATAVRFQALYGEPMTDWELAAHWDARRPFLACAMPRTLLQTLKTVAQEYKLTLLEIVPQVIASWNRWHAEVRPASWFGVLHDNVLTIGAMHQQRLYAVRAVPFSVADENDPGWLPRHLKREALRLRTAMPAQLQLCGVIPGSWVMSTAATLRCTRLDVPIAGAPVSVGVALARLGTQQRRAAPLRIDFSPPTLRRAVVQTRPMTWLFGAASLMLCIASAFSIFTVTNKNKAQTNSLQQAQAQLVERAARTAPAKKTMIPEAQARAINAAILQLNLPWSEVLNAIEEATPATVALLALEPDAKKHSLKGMAEAKSSGEMIAYIEQLKQQAFFGNVALAKYEINELDANKPIRFQFEAQWKDSTQ